MNAALTRWLETRAAKAGLLAYGVRASETVCHCEGSVEKCPAEKMEKILHYLADAQPWLFNDRFSPRWSTWAFEQGQIRFALRPDGHALGLVAAADAATPPLDELCAEFLALQLNS